MKKIKLEFEGAGEALSKEEMMQIEGGGDGGCSVTCNSGHYSCCNAPSSCVCVLDGNNENCSAGGPESSSCSIS